MNDDPVVIARHALERELVEFRDAGGTAWAVRMAIEDLMEAHRLARSVTDKPAAEPK